MLERFYGGTWGTLFLAKLSSKHAVLNMLDSSELTPKAANAAEYLSDAKRVNFGHNFPRIWILLYLQLQVRIRVGDVPVHLRDCFGVFQRFVARGS